MSFDELRIFIRAVILENVNAPFIIEPGNDERAKLASKYAQDATYDFLKDLGLRRGKRSKRKCSADTGFGNIKPPPT